MRGNVQGPNTGDDLQQWFRDIPLVTKFFTFSTLLLGFLITFSLISTESVLFDAINISTKFQVWRLITPFIFSGKFSFNFAMHLMILYENCRRYENNPYNTGAGGTTADFVFMLLFSMTILLVIAYIFQFLVLSESILYVIMYVWSRREPDAQLNIFGFKFKAIYLPWVYLLIKLVMGQDMVLPLIGIVVGHLYYFLADVVPMTYGRSVLKTPEICVSIVNYFSGGIRLQTNSIPAGRAGTTPTGPGATGTTGATAGGTRGGGHNWGRGNVLGGN